MNRRPSQSRTGFDSFSPQHTAHFKAAQPGGEFFEPKPRASLGRRLLLALLLLMLIALAVNLAVNQFVRVARVTVPIRRMDSAFEGYTLLQISDLKGATYGSNQALIRFALQNKDFDAVVFTGDMVSSRGNAQPLYALIEMLRELGYCTGIENYSRVISGRPVGSPPLTLIDYFPKDFLLFVDESHVTLPQVRAMYNGDRARKESLVEYGFRLPCAFDNRPLKFDEFEQRVHQRIYVSATPGDYEKDRAGQIVEQVIRPTGLLDPKVEVRPVENQIDDLVGEINARAARNERVLVTTLTKKLAEDLTQYLTGVGIRVRYMHADVETIERMELIRGLRLGEFDVLVGINLLREGLDIPEVSMVAILDADKEGFLRSETSLIQTIGRAARNAGGLVVLYADTITPSMRRAMDETERRRQIQDDYNKAHGIIPQTIRKDVREIIEISKKDEESARRRGKRKLSERERDEEIRKLEKQMQEASRMLEFEYAAILRDRIIELRKENTK